MKLMKLGLVLLAPLFCAAPLFAQQGFVVELTELDQQLDSICGGSGRPLADGTVVYIYHDIDSDGPDDTDPLATVCSNPPFCAEGPSGTVNMNQFVINGADPELEFPGGFMLGVGVDMYYFRSIAMLPSPPYFYLRVCLPGRRYVSSRLGGPGGLVSGPQSYEIETWTCENLPCPGCEPPPTPTNFQASDSTSCTSITLTWNYPDSASITPPVDKIIVYREGDSIGWVRPVVTTYVDSVGLVSGQPYSYYLKARRNCTGTYAYAQTQGTSGILYPSPPAVTMLTATDDSCNAVRVSWSFATTAGIDSFIIRRNGVRVGAVHFGSTPGTRSFIHVTTDSTRGGYRVSARNPVCGEASFSAVDSGRAAQPPAYAPTTINATDGLCNVTTVTWDSVGGTVTAYKIYRYNNDGSGQTLLGTVTLPASRVFNDNTSPAGTTYRYRVRASNTCGDGPISTADDTGYRVTTPATVTGVTATDGTSCDMVLITWSNIAQETGYKVSRRHSGTGVVDTFLVAADTVQYRDSTAVPGVNYYYKVRGYNACGNGPVSTTVDSLGFRKAPPGQVQNVQASDSTGAAAQCWGVLVTWTSLTADSFQIRRNGSRIGVRGSGITSYPDSTAQAGQVYSYTVTAYNNCGPGLESAPDNGSVRRRPGQVTGLSATDTRCDSIRLTWNALSNADSFRIIRDGVVVNRVAGTITAYNDQPNPGTYVYRILAVNTCGLGDTSAADNGTRLATPDAVASINATDTRCDSVLVTWTDVAGEDSFQIRRNGSRIAVVSPNVLEYRDVPPDTGTRYKYEVAAYNACGALTPTASDSGGMLPRPGQVTSLWGTFNSCDYIRLTWFSAANVDTYIVFRNDVELVRVPASDTSYVDNTATPGGTYRYFVRTMNTCGLGLPSGEVGGYRIVFPSVPTSLACTQTLCDRIRIVWNASTGDVDSYRLIRDGTDSVTVSKDSTGYDDMTATPGQHTYRIRAVSDECGVTGLCCDNVYGTRLEPVGVPANVQATNQRCDSVVVTWSAASGDVDGYIVYENGVPVATVGPDTLRFAYQPPVGAYIYTVRALSYECGYGNISAQDGGARLALPTTVTNLSATADRCDGVQLQWTTGTGQINGYIVRRDAAILDTVPDNQTQYFDGAAPVGSGQYDVISYSEFCDDSDPTAPVTGIRLADPVSPDAIAATDTLCDSVVVTWSAGGGTFDGYHLYRDGNLHATLPVGTQRFAEAPTSGVTYWYSVTAWDTVCGEATALDSAQGMRQADAGVPQNLVATDACDAVEVSWSTATGAVAEYRVYRNDTLLVTVYPPDTTYADTSAERGVTYTYRVAAFSTGCGETAPSNGDDGMRLPLPTQVLGLVASNDNCVGIAIEWSAVTGTQWYRIYRDDVLYDSVSGSARATSYLDTNVLPRASHEYKVGSVNICGQGDLSDSAEGTRYDVPDAVTGFFASDSSCTAIYLVWQDVATDTAYVIYRDGNPIDTVSSGVTSYEDTDATSGSHDYMVRALNECGLSTASEIATGYRIPGVAVVTGLTATSGRCNDIILVWSDLPNEDGYIVVREGSPIGTLGANDTTFTDTVAPGTYLYAVQAFNVCGLGTRSASVTGFRATVPPQVTNVSATRDSCTSVTVTWTDVATEQYYLIYRGAMLVDTVDSNVTVFVDAPLTPGGYIYTVQAGNYCGNGPLSAQASGRVADVPAQVTGVTASTADCDTIFLVWRDLVDESSYRIYMDGVLVATNVQSDTTFSAATTIGTHQFAVQGVNYCGVGDTSVWVTGERQGPPTVAPNVTAPASACASAGISWLTVPDVTHYVIYLDGDSTGTTTDTVASVAADSGYHVVMVRGWNECGPGPLSDPDTIYYVPAVAQVTGVVADSMNCVTVTITWNDLVTETAYDIARNDTVVGSVLANVTQFVDTPPIGTHTYKVRGRNTCYTGPYSSPVSGRRRGAPATTTVTASDTSCSVIIVSWLPVNDVLGYLVFQNGTRIDSVGAGTLSVTLTPTPGAYAYTVQPLNDCGLANISVVDSGHRLTVPARVAGVAATGNRCDSVIVTWTDVLTETGYAIYRDDTVIASVGANIVRFADLPSTGAHEYKVRADNQCGSGAISDSVMGTRLVYPLAPVTVQASDTLCGQIRVTWQSGGGDVDSFKVYRNNVILVTVAGGVLEFVDAVTGTFTYKVAAKSTECGDSPFSNEDTGTGHAPAGVPGAPVFPGPVVCDSIRITWPAATGEVEGYIVHRDGVAVDSVGTMSYTDTGVDDPLPHSYAVKAYNSFCGASALSASVTGSMRRLITPLTDVPDTAYCRDTLTARFAHCSGVTVDSFFLSVENGPFTFIAAFDPPADSIALVVPIVDSLARYTEDCRIMVRSYRGARVDADTSDYFVIDCDLAADEMVNEIPKEFFLDQNYPNPFNPLTNIRFGVPRDANVTIEIYDVLGRKAATLVNGLVQPGIHTVTWDCSACPSGMYLIRMTTNEKVLLRKMLLMK